MEQFRGTGVALITPFTSKGEIDFEALEKLVHYQVDNGVDYLVVLGTTGETATLSKEEKDQIERNYQDNYGLGFNRKRGLCGK